MKYRKPPKDFCFLRYLYIALSLCGVLIAALADCPAPTRAALKPQGQERAEPKSPGLPKYDIRLSGKDGFEDFDLTTPRGRQRAQQNAHARARLTAVDNFLTTRPEAGQNLRVIANETGAMKHFFIEGETLSDPRSDTPDNIARNFLSRHAELFASKTADLKLMNEDNDEGTVFLEYVQTRGGIKVYDGQVQVVVNKNGEVLSVREGFLVDNQEIKLRPTVSEARGIASAFDYAGKTVSPSFVETHTRESQTEFSRFANPLDLRLEEVLSQLTVLRVENTARLAWRVYAEVGPLEWYEVLVDAHTGELLYRRNLYVDAQGTVYTNSPARAPRQLVQFPFAWIGSSTITSGANVQAYLDADGNNGPDPNNGPGLSNGFAFSPNQDFTFPFSTAVDPGTQQAAVVTNLFYFNNIMHDFSNNLGFNQASRNFDGNDPVLAEAQDPFVTNNANFATPPDGISPRMQMGIFTAFGPPSDTSVDGDVVFHEYGHGISNRLIGNGDGALFGTQSGAMGEGWSDYWAATINGDGAIGEYVANNPRGLRRAAYTVPANAVHDSYADVGVGGFEVHKDGEVWAATLWDLRSQLGASTTNRLVLQGMRFTPARPSFLNGRDGILQADQNLFGGANRCTIWTVFARHGMGVSAVGNDGTTHTAATNVPSDCGGLPPAYEGYVDGADCSQIWGWAWDSNRPNTPINVDIYANSSFVASVPANLFRQDLLNAGKGDGYHAFVFNTPGFLKNGQTQSISVRFGGTNTNLFSSPRSIVCGASLFPTEVPQTTASGQGATWEQGVEFSSNVSGYITAIRFWKAPGERTGGHVGKIWSASGGSPLATAQFFNESSSGWQEAQLSTPFPITAGVRYKVTYNVYDVVSKTFDVFNGPITRPQLTAWGSSYSTPAGSFPTTGSTSNLFADIKFNSPR